MKKKCSDSGMFLKEQVLKELKVMAKAQGQDVLVVANYLLDNSNFEHWSGSSKEYQHHYGQGGLINHTSEVIKLCFSSIKTLDGHDYKIDPKELFLAALFHDCGKLFDYKPTNHFPYYSHWEGTDHKRYIHHISRSGLMWSEAAKRSDVINDKYHDKVLHAILSHHGTREWGSPVAPKSRVAWLVHHCDCISARMYDADTWDCVKGS